MNKLLIHIRIKKCISIMEATEINGTIPEKTVELLYSRKYANAMRVLENSGCIKCSYAWGIPLIPISVGLTKVGFSVYQLSRHDVWANRFWGFISGLAVGILGSIFVGFIL